MTTTGDQSDAPPLDRMGRLPPEYRCDPTVVHGCKGHLPATETLDRALASEYQMPASETPGPGEDPEAEAWAARMIKPGLGEGDLRGEVEPWQVAKRTYRERRFAGESQEQAWRAVIAAVEQRTLAEQQVARVEALVPVADLRAALADPEADRKCAGCRAPLRQNSRGLYTCDSDGCPGNLADPEADR